MVRAVGKHFRKTDCVCIRKFLGLEVSFGLVIACFDETLESKVKHQEL